VPQAEAKQGGAKQYKINSKFVKKGEEKEKEEEEEEEEEEEREGAAGIEPGTTIRRPQRDQRPQYAGGILLQSISSKARNSYKTLTSFLDPIQK
jgi:hypothetical protein